MQNSFSGQTLAKLVCFKIDKLNCYLYKNLNWSFSPKVFCLNTWLSSFKDNWFFFRYFSSWYTLEEWSYLLLPKCGIMSNLSFYKVRKWILDWLDLAFVTLKENAIYFQFLMVVWQTFLFQQLKRITLTKVASNYSKFFFELYPLALLSILALLTQKLIWKIGMKKY